MSHFVASSFGSTGTLPRERSLIPVMSPKEFNYRLILLTHGDAPHLDRCLESFAEHVRPRPAENVCVIDGDESRLPSVGPLGMWEIVHLPTQLGFCEASRVAWGLAKMRGADAPVAWIFWLENDFEFTRPVDLSVLAAVIEEHPYVAQMSLMRQPVNLIERRAGGIVASRPGEFTRWPLDFSEPIKWLEQESYWTTNPSLFPRRLAAEFQWPDGPECEGKHGVALREAGYSFGVWGDGSEWVQHLGERTGVGY